MAFFHNNSTTMMARLQQGWILSLLLDAAVQRVAQACLESLEAQDSQHKPVPL